MVKDAPNEVDNFILFILIIVKNSNGVDYTDDLFDGFDFKQGFFYYHFLQLVDFLEQRLIFLILNYDLHYPKYLQNSFLSVNTGYKKFDMLDNELTNGGLMQFGQLNIGRKNQLLIDFTFLHNYGDYVT